MRSVSREHVIEEGSHTSDHLARSQVQNSLGGIDEARVLASDHQISIRNGGNLSLRMCDALIEGCDRASSKYLPLSCVCDVACQAIRNKHASESSKSCVRVSMYRNESPSRIKLLQEDLKPDRLEAGSDSTSSCRCNRRGRLRLLWKVRRKVRWRCTASSSVGLQFDLAG